MNHARILTGTPIRQAIWPLACLAAIAAANPASACGKPPELIVVSTVPTRGTFPGEESINCSGPPMHLIMAAAHRGDLARIRELVARGVPLSGLTSGDQPMLHWAMGKRDRRAFKTLLAAGADPRQPDRDGDPALVFAAMQRSSFWLRFLLAQGVSPNAANSITGKTALMAAMLHERPKHVRLLMQAGANPDLTDRTGNSALHAAAQINEPWHIRTMLEAGANPRASNAQGQSFQRYLFMTQDKLLNAHHRRGRAAVAAWLTAHDIALETQPG